MAIQFLLISLFLSFHLSFSIDSIEFDMPVKFDKKIIIGLTNQLVYKSKWIHKKEVDAHFYVSSPGENCVVLSESEKRGVLLTNGEHWQTVNYMIEVVATNKGKTILPDITFDWISTNSSNGVLERFSTNISIPPLTAKLNKVFLWKYMWLVGKWFLLLMILGGITWTIRNYFKNKEKKKHAAANKLLWDNFVEMIKSKESLRFQPDKKLYFLFLIDACRQFNEQAQKSNCPIIPKKIVANLEHLENEVKLTSDPASSKIEINVAEFDKYIEQRSKNKQ